MAITKKEKEVIFFLLFMLVFNVILIIVYRVGVNHGIAAAMRDCIFSANASKMVNVIGW